MEGGMENFIKWASIIIIVLAIVFCGLYWSQMTKVRQDITSKSDEDYIIMVLRAKGADDCVLRPISDGVWSCTEWKSGKVFMVRR